MQKQPTEETVSGREKKETVQINPMIGGVVGAIAGGAVGSVVAAAFNNESTRKKILERFETIRKQAVQTLNDIKEDEDIREKVRHYVKEGRKTSRGSDTK